MSSKFSRRAFIQPGAAAADGSLVVGKPLLPEEDQEPATLKPLPSSDRVRFGIIGVGMQGSGLLEESLSLGVAECVIAADLYDGRHTLAREIADNPSLPTTRRYQDVLDRDDVDCVIVAVPDHHHRTVVLDALSAGKDVYCEKPLSHQPSEGFDIAEAARKHDRILMVGSQRVSSALCRKASEIYREGAIGDVSMVELSLGRNTPTGAWRYPPPPDLSPDNLDWHAWLGSAPRIPFDAIRFARWRCWREYGTGVAGDLMVHLISGMLATLSWNEVPRSARSLGGIVRWKDGRNMPDLHAVLFDYHGVPVYVRLGLGTYTPELMRIMGPGGAIEVSGSTLTVSPQEGVDRSPSYYASAFPAEMRETYQRQWYADHPVEPGNEPISEDVRYTGNDWDDVRPHLANFFRSVKTKEPVVEDAVFGNHAALACHMANESYFRGGAVRWNDATRTIEG
jgi:predicted dehydrogenase